ncbi:hypothetical protein V8E53_014285 [Lactarius tabidus]
MSLRQPSVPMCRVCQRLATHPLGSLKVRNLTGANADAMQHRMRDAADDRERCRTISGWGGAVLTCGGGDPVAPSVQREGSPSNSLGWSAGGSTTRSFARKCSYRSRVRWGRGAAFEQVLHGDDSPAHSYMPMIPDSARKGSLFIPASTLSGLLIFCIKTLFPSTSLLCLSFSSLNTSLFCNHTYITCLRYLLNDSALPVTGRLFPDSWRNIIVMCTSSNFTRASLPCLIFPACNVRISPSPSTASSMATAEKLRACTEPGQARSYVLIDRLDNGWLMLEKVQ